MRTLCFFLAATPYHVIPYNLRLLLYSSIYFVFSSFFFFLKNLTKTGIGISESVQWMCRHLWSLDFLLTSVVLFPIPHNYGYHLCPYAPHFSDFSREILIFFYVLVLFCSHPSIIRNYHVYNLADVLFLAMINRFHGMFVYTKIP